MTETKYGKHIVPIPVIPMFGEGNGSQGWDLWGKDLGNFEVNIAQRCFKELGRMNPEYQKRPHTHAFDEILFFLSSDTDDLSRLGSVAEMRMGSEEEKHIIARPTAVWVPEGLPHCPITFLSVDKPCLFMHVAFAATRPGRNIKGTP
jgi:hypothetical protein